MIEHFDPKKYNTLTAERDGDDVIITIVDHGIDEADQTSTVRVPVAKLRKLLDE